MGFFEGDAFWSGLVPAFTFQHGRRLWDHVGLVWAFRMDLRGNNITLGSIAGAILVFTFLTHESDDEQRLVEKNPTIMTGAI